MEVKPLSKSLAKTMFESIQSSTLTKYVRANYIDLMAFTLQRSYSKQQIFFLIFHVFVLVLLFMQNDHHCLSSA